MAIAYFNNELVQDLVEAGANVEQRAIGKVKINSLLLEFNNISQKPFNTF